MDLPSFTKSHPSFKNFTNSWIWAHSACFAPGSKPRNAFFTPQVDMHFVKEPALLMKERKKKNKKTAPGGIWTHDLRILKHVLYHWTQTKTHYFQYFNINLNDGHFLFSIGVWISLAQKRCLMGNLDFRKSSKNVLYHLPLYSQKIMFETQSLTFSCFSYFN